MPSVKTKDLISGYGNLKIIDGVSIDVEESRVTSIIGPNGAGKSTLIKTIYGFLKPWRGKVLYGDEDITGQEPHTLLQKGIAFVLQRQSIFPFLTVQENLEMGAWTIKRDKKRSRESIDVIYARFPILKEKRKQNAKDLSGGMKRMLEMGRALITNPKLIILDEPSAGLAPKVISELYKKFAELKELKITFLIVDQNVRRAVEIADHVYVLEDGRVSLEGSGGDLKGDLMKHIESWLRF